MRRGEFEGDEDLKGVNSGLLLRERANKSKNAGPSLGRRRLICFHLSSFFYCLRDDSVRKPPCCCDAIGPFFTNERKINDNEKCRSVREFFFLCPANPKPLLTI